MLEKIIEQYEYRLSLLQEIGVSVDDKVYQETRFKLTLLKQWDKQKDKNSETD